MLRASTLRESEFERNDRPGCDGGNYTSHGWYFCGPEALAGVLTGSIISGSTMAIMMAGIKGDGTTAKVRSLTRM